MEQEGILHRDTANFREIKLAELANLFVTPRNIDIARRTLRHRSWSQRFWLAAIFMGDEDGNDGVYVWDRNWNATRRDNRSTT